MTETQTTTTHAIHFHVGWNMPGYLPECDVEMFETFEDAKRYLIGVMDNEGDYLFDIDRKDDADELSAEMQNLNLDNGPEWETIVGNTSWWIMPCVDDRESEY
jgi:hypothetical protein